MDYANEKRSPRQRQRLCATAGDVVPDGNHRRSDVFPQVCEHRSGKRNQISEQVPPIVPEPIEISRDRRGKQVCEFCANLHDRQHGTCACQLKRSPPVCHDGNCLLNGGYHGLIKAGQELIPLVATWVLMM